MMLFSSHTPGLSLSANKRTTILVCKNMNDCLDELEISNKLAVAASRSYLRAYSYESNTGVYCFESVDVIRSASTVTTYFFSNAALRSRNGMAGLRAFPRLA